MAPGAQRRQQWLVHTGLALTWIAIVVWLGFEHRSVEHAKRESLLNRTRDISNTIALVSRTGRLGVVRHGRFQETLEELAQYQQIQSVALLNSAGEIVVAAGEPIDPDLSNLPRQGSRWEKHRLTVVNLVDFGPASSDGTERPPTIVLPDEPERRDGPPFPPAPPPGEARRNDDGTTRTFFQGRFDERRGGETRRNDDDTTRSAGASRGGEEPRDARGDRRSDRRLVFSRPFWMSEQEYQQLLARQGLHGFALVMSTADLEAEIRRDLLLRSLIGGVALIAVVGIGLAWNSRERSTQLQMRLVRSHEMNEHLRELNVAAAGLAHETRNPLSIVRGVAQMIEKEEGLPAETRGHAHQIVGEVDLVTDRLNEFIKYSRPMEPRPAPADLLAVVRNVQRVLESDREDKGATIAVEGPELTVQADESLLRQVVFNLMLNALQSIGTGGRVLARAEVDAHGEARLTIEDDGPGVPDGLREQVFRPYFTTREKGSGLGLAVVRQIVLAHRWEIDCNTGALGGAAFRLRGMRILKGRDGPAHES